MSDQKYIGIVEASKGLPPDEAFAQNPTIENYERFLISRHINLYVNSRLASFFDSSITPLKPPEKLDERVRTIAAWRLAQYTLLFEVWDWYKPLAIQERLLPPNANCRDCMRLIYEQKHVAYFAKKPVRNRTMYGWGSKAIKSNELKDEIEADLNLGKFVSPIKLAKLKDNNEKAFSTKTRLESLLEEVAQKVGRNDDVVQNAYIAMGKALNTLLKSSSRYMHHKNQTR